MLRGLLLAIVFDQVYFWLTVESTNCLFDLEQAEGSLDRSYHVQLIPFPLLPIFLHLNEHLWKHIFSHYTVPSFLDSC